MGYNNDLRC